MFFLFHVPLDAGGYAPCSFRAQHRRSETQNYNVPFAPLQVGRPPKWNVAVSGDGGLTHAIALLKSFIRAQV